MLETLDRPKTLKETALEKLREAITLGVFEPGDRLVERVLCEKLGVSRSVIRECIRHLESERLVTVIPNAGPSVAVLEPAEVREIYEIRAMLESTAARNCAIHANDATLKDLTDSRDAIARSLAAGDVIEALSRTRRFYRIIFTAGGKTVSWDLVEHLNARIARLRALTLSSEGRATSGPASLRKIVAAIARRDPDAAGEACESHVAEASRIALTRLSARVGGHPQRKSA